MHAHSRLPLAVLTTLLAALCLAGTAQAAVPISAGSATVTQNAFDPSSVQVDWSVDAASTGDPISAYIWVLPAWDDACTVDPLYFEDSVPDPAYSLVEHHDMTGSTHYADTETFSIAPGIAYCIGASFSSNYYYIGRATRVNYNTPYAEGNGGATLYPDKIDVPITIHPRGLPTTWNITWFKKLNTTDCSSPDAGDLATAQDTAEQTISDDLWGDHQVVGQITGLTKESDYCVRVNDSNAAGPESDSDHFWTYNTIGLPPTVTNESYTAGSDSIGFSLDLTPNVPDGMFSAMLRFEYFKETGDDCSPLVDPDGYSYYDYWWLPYDSGYNPIAVSDTISGLSPGATYCIRALSNTPNGDSEPGDFQEVKLVQKQAVTATLAVGPSDNADASLNVKLDDHGAAGDEGSPSSYYLDVYGIGFDRCNTEDYHGSDDHPLVGEEYDFSGSVELNIDLSPIVYDREYCAVVHTESAWGQDYDTITYLPFKGGKKPDLLEVGFTKTADSITVNGSLNPNNFATSYNANYFLAQGDDDCDAYSGATSASDDYSVAANISTPTAFAASISGLSPGTTYCVNAAASNVFGATFSDWQRVTTNLPPDTTPPSIPTGLSASNVTQTSATLSWNASTDNTAVTGYNVYLDGAAYKSTSGSERSTTVTLLCGQTTHFRVSAFDGASPSNESAQSAELAITGAACDVPPTGGGDTTPPPTIDPNCFSSREVRGQFKTTVKKKSKAISVRVTATPSADFKRLNIQATGNATITFTVDGKKVANKKGKITVSSFSAKTVKVKFKAGNKSKVLTLKIAHADCPVQAY
ncbi:MAG: hypothetical protein QM648_09545 [Solirubrobacterales bacterium]